MVPRSVMRYGESLRWRGCCMKATRPTSAGVGAVRKTFNVAFRTSLMKSFALSSQLRIVCATTTLTAAHSLKERSGHGRFKFSFILKADPPGVRVNFYVYFFFINVSPRGVSNFFFLPSLEVWKCSGKRCLVVIGVAAGCCWLLLGLLLVAAVCCWLLLFAVGFCCFLLVAVGFCWLGVQCYWGYCWFLLVAVGCCWLLLVAVGCYWGFYPHWIICSWLTCYLFVLFSSKNEHVMPADKIQQSAFLLLSCAWKDPRQRSGWTNVLEGPDYKSGRVRRARLSVIP